MNFIKRIGLLTTGLVFSLLSMTSCFGSTNDDPPPARTYIILYDDITKTEGYYTWSKMESYGCLCWTSGFDVEGKSEYYDFIGFYYGNELISADENFTGSDLCNYLRNKSPNYDGQHYVHSLFKAKVYKLNLTNLYGDQYGYVEQGHGGYFSNYFTIETVFIKEPTPYHYVYVVSAPNGTNYWYSDHGINGYKDLDTGEIYDTSGQIELTKLRDLNLEIIWSQKQYHINYYNVGQIDNPNPVSYIHGEGGILNLEPLSSQAFTFNGWRYKGQLVSSIDLSINEDIELYADVTPNIYYVDYYVDGTLYKRVPYDYLNPPVVPEVPSVEGKIGNWDNKTFDEFKNYEVHAEYKDDMISTLVTGDFMFMSNGNRGDYIVSNAYKNCLDNYCDEKGLLYFENNAERVSFIDSKEYETLEGYSIKYREINSIDDFLSINTYPSAAFKLNVDLDFAGATIPLTNVFTGMFNGNGKTIKNFKVSNKGLFGTNKGIIYNINFEDFYFTNNVLEINKGDALINNAIITAVNEGMIYKVNVFSKDQLSIYNHVNYIYHKGDINSGLICGTNTGLISSCSTDLEFNNIYQLENGVPNLDLKTDTSDVITRGGLITGLNNGVIEESTVYEFGNYFNTINTIYSPLDGSWSYGKITYRDGSIAGENNGSIINCLSNAGLKVNSSAFDQYDEMIENFSIIESAGGLVGTNKVNGVIKTSSVSGSIMSLHTTIGNTGGSFIYNAGGIAAENSGTLSECYFDSRINTNYRKAYIGGLVGTNNATGKVTNCLVDGTIELLGKEVSYVGGLISINKGVVDHCIAKNKVDASLSENDKNCVAGFILTNHESGDIRNSISYANIVNANLDKYHLFTVDNLLGFSYNNYYTHDDTYVSGHSESAFMDNTTEVDTNTATSLAFLILNNYYTSIWDVVNGEYLLKEAR